MLKPILVKTLETVCSKYFDSIVFGMPITSIHSCHKYLAFTQHCHLVFSSCVVNEVAIERIVHSYRICKGSVILGILVFLIEFTVLIPLQVF